MSSWLGARRSHKKTSCARSGTSAASRTRRRRNRRLRLPYSLAMPETNRCLSGALNGSSLYSLYMESGAWGVERTIRERYTSRRERYGKDGGEAGRNVHVESPQSRPGRSAFWILTQCPTRRAQ